MKFGFIESMCDPSHYLPLAQALEANGWDFFYVADSICYPREASDNYPYNEDGTRAFLDGKPFLEPMSLVPAMGAVTRRLCFATDVLKVPIRQPVLLAKSITSVAVLTGGRFRLGAGLSPWPEDFLATGTDWPSRGTRLDQMIEILRGLMTGDYFEYHSEHYDIPALKLCPVPREPVPILIGGHSQPALRRAARLGDGWISAGDELSELGAMLARLRGLLRDAGRKESGFELHLMPPMTAHDVGTARGLRDLGATHAILSPRNPYVEGDMPLQAKLDFVKRYADQVIGKL
jgi:probable F420-dependent oxidoreductase